MTSVLESTDISDMDLIMARMVHQCKLCQTKFAHTRNNLYFHLRRNHRDYSVKDYYNDHVCNSFANPTSMWPTHRCQICKDELPRSPAILNKHLADQHNVTLSKYFQDHSSFLNVRTISEWAEQCRYDCGICKINGFPYNAFEKHLKNWHCVTTTEYIVKHGLGESKISYHHCQVCGKGIAHNFQHLDYHVKKYHGMVNLGMYVMFYVHNKQILKEVRESLAYRQKSPEQNINPIADEALTCSQNDLQKNQEFKDDLSRQVNFTSEY